MEVETEQLYQKLYNSHNKELKALKAKQAEELRQHKLKHVEERKTLESAIEVLKKRIKDQIKTTPTGRKFKRGRYLVSDFTVGDRLISLNGNAGTVVKVENGRTYVFFDQDIYHQAYWYYGPNYQTLRLRYAGRMKLQFNPNLAIAEMP